MYQKEMFRGKKITVMGLGLLGRGVGDVLFLAEEGADLIVTDLKSKKELKESLDKLKKYKNICYRLGKHDLKDFEGRDFILKSAGVPKDSPFIKHAQKSNTPVFMSTALFSILTPATVIGFTGTRGKTTVTHMVYEILKSRYAKSKNKVFLGGNIRGIATLPFIKKTRKGDMVVLELDSWQLQGFGDLKISPKVSAFTTFMPDHLNYYKGDLKSYFSDKANIFRFQNKGDIFVAGEQLCTLPSYFTKLLPKDTHFISERALPKRIKLKIPGEHNRYNAAIAFSIARSLKIGVGIISKALEGFSGVPGRLEYLKTYKGIKIYNDTTSTTPEALLVALEALGTEKNISLIMGGSEKNLDLSILPEALRKYCIHIALLKGTGTERLLKEKIIPSNIPYSLHGSLKDACKKSFKNVSSGGVVLLSPGFASFGMFENEYDRGDQFRDFVNKLKG